MTGTMIGTINVTLTGTVMTLMMIDMIIIVTRATYNATVMRRLDGNMLITVILITIHVTINVTVTGILPRQEISTATLLVTMTTLVTVFVLAVSLIVTAVTMTTCDSFPEIIDIRRQGRTPGGVPTAYAEADP
jgi:hypothetical protein